ncbi:MAG TPA: hypothetical protein VM432_06580 [Bdellovibrionales bacterium]|nr:hypothetical protein [Bdellovibrionales bacterium]
MLTVLILLISFSSFSNAQEFALDARFGQIISYKKLMRLSPAKRTAYIAAVRDLMIEVEKMQHAKMSKVATSDERQRINIYVEFLKQFIAVAEAAGTNVPFYVSNGGLEKERVQCKPPLKAVRVSYTRNAGDIYNFICVQGRTLPAKGDKPAQTIATVFKTCPAGTQAAVQRADGKSFCVTPESLRKVQPASSRNALVAPNKKFLANAKKPSTVAAKPAVDTKRKSESRQPAKKRANKKEVAQEPPPSSIEESAAAAEEIPLDQLAPEEGLVCNILETKEGKVTKAELADRSPESKFCTDESIAAVRERFYADKSNVSCFYGGTITEYLDGQKGAGRCLGSPRFCYGANSDCRMKDNPGEYTTPAFKCENDRQIICNPLVYGVQPNEKPYCVDRSANVTASCAEIAKVGEAITIDKFYAAPGVMEGWDAFAKSFNALCTENELSKRFNCRECHLIRQRLVATNLAMLDAPDCGKIAVYTESMYKKRDEHIAIVTQPNLITASEDSVGVTGPSKAPASAAQPTVQ